MSKNITNYPSLRKRYALQTITLGILIISTAVLMYSNVLNQRQTLASAVEFIDSQFVQVGLLRNNLLSLQFSIDNYLLDPTLNKRDELINSILSKSKERITTFKNREMEQHGHELGTVPLIEAYSQLQTSVKKLLDIRVDVERQYPAMSLSAFAMGIHQDEVENNLTILIDEVEADDFTPISESLYPLLLKTKILWRTLVSQMRIYLANRLASFSTDILVLQAKSVEEINNQLTVNIQKLKEIYQHEEDSFEGLGAIEELDKELIKWLEKFNEMRRLSESPQWRQDWNLMESEIIPTATLINRELIELENRLRVEERDANKTVKENTNQVFILMAGIIIAIILFIMMTIISLNLKVFKPIMSVANALRAKAFGEKVQDFSDKQSQETKILVDAFEELDHQVNLRQTKLEQQARQLMNYQTELETKVKERTEDLQKSNTTLTATIDELHETQEQLIETEKMAALGNLVSGVAHEINTPIGVSVTASSTLTDDIGTIKKDLENGQLKRKSLNHFLERVEDGVSIIERNLLRASDLIRNFKQVAVDQARGEAREINLRNYLEEILSSLYPKWKNSPVKVDVEVEKNINFHTYPGELAQVITNLMINSLVHGFNEASVPGTILIRGQKKQDKVIIEFIDNGKGMENEVLEKIFDPFFTTNRKGGGTGLGMHIVYNLVSRQLKGTIDCTSNPGKGCKISIQIPAHLKLVD